MLFGNHKNVVSGEKKWFLEKFWFFEGKIGPKNGPKPSTLSMSQLFRKIAQRLFLSYERNFSHIFRRKDPETSKKGPFHACCIAMITF